MSEKRIVIVANALDGGGAERSMRLIHKEMLKRGYDIHLIALNASNTTNVKSGNFEIELSRKWKSGVLDTISNLRQFQQAIRLFKPGTLIINCELPELFASLSILRGTKIIAVEHTSNPWFGRKKLGILVRGILLVKQAKWITVSRGQSRVWPFHQPIQHIPNPVVVEGAPTVGSYDEHSLVFLGRLRSEKRPDWVLEAASQVGLGVDVIGDGELKESLENRYQINTAFHGFSNSPWAKISSEQVVIVTSEFEGDGLVVAESIIRGQPILLVDIPDLRRFELSENCYFKNQEELVAKLELVKSSGVEDIRPSKQVQEHMKATRSLSVVCNSWEEIILLN
jgi:glycosyltransferase involved in cell wall biosynthesis